MTRMKLLLHRKSSAVRLQWPDEDSHVNRIKHRMFARQLESPQNGRKKEQKIVIVAIMAKNHELSNLPSASLVIASIFLQQQISHSNGYCITVG